MSTYYKNKRTGEMVEYPPYLCKICGQKEIEYPHYICECCGWEDDSVQNNDKDFIGGANPMSFNQYKKFWEENKDDILQHLKDNRFYAIEKSQEYYEKYHKEANEEKIRKEFNDNF